MPATLVKIRGSELPVACKARCVSRAHCTHLSAVDSPVRSSSVRLSPEERKLSASEHGRGERVALVSSAWSQLRGN